MILGQGLIFLFKVLSFDYQMTYCFQWMRTLLLSMWTPIYLHQVHFPEFNRWSKKVKVHAYLNRISTLLICTTCGKVYKQILLKIFQNINQDNLHYSHIFTPIMFLQLHCQAGEMRMAQYSKICHVRLFGFESFKCLFLMLNDQFYLKFYDVAFI